MTKPVNIATDGSADLAAVRDAVARRVQAMRRARGWSMDEFCRRSSIAKGVLVETEKAAANPSIATLCKAAAALGVSVAELVAIGDTSQHGMERGTVLWHGEAGGRGTLLIGTPGPDMLELWRWTMMPGESHLADAHVRGTTELIHVESGALTLTIGRTRTRLERSQSMAVRTDRRHTYANHEPEPLVFTMAVFEPGQADRDPPRPANLAGAAPARE